MKCRPWEHDQFANVALGNGTVLVSEQDGGRFVNLVVVNLVQANTFGITPVKMS